uniref:BZIP domain-containing protein n=1 Tax=Mycena chlorophos TaxID=658473 RepID=A0ABQ0KYF2_MYCCL|nr:predicted protein [Mycena chlorophos]
MSHAQLPRNDALHHFDATMPLYSLEEAQGWRERRDQDPWQQQPHAYPLPTQPQHPYRTQGEIALEYFLYQQQQRQQQIPRETRYDVGIDAPTPDDETRPTKVRVVEPPLYRYVLFSAPSLFSRVLIEPQARYGRHLKTRVRNNRLMDANRALCDQLREVAAANAGAAARERAIIAEAVAREQVVVAERLSLQNHAMQLEANLNEAYAKLQAYQEPTCRPSALTLFRSAQAEQANDNHQLNISFHIHMNPLLNAT